VKAQEQADRSGIEPETVPICNDKAGKELFPLTSENKTSQQKFMKPTLKNLIQPDESLELLKNPTYYAIEHEHIHWFILTQCYLENPYSLLY
jgi:hypothetical protein